VPKKCPTCAQKVPNMCPKSAQKVNIVVWNKNWNRTSLYWFFTVFIFGQHYICFLGTFWAHFGQQFWVPFWAPFWATLSGSFFCAILDNIFEERFRELGKASQRGTIDEHYPKSPPPPPNAKKQRNLFKQRKLDVLLRYHLYQTNSAKWYLCIGIYA
jgi:hypothetical protein